MRTSRRVVKFRPVLDRTERSIAVQVCASARAPNETGRLPCEERARDLDHTRAPCEDPLRMTSA